MNTDRECKKCKCLTTWELRRHLTRSGSTVYGWLCLECEQWQNQTGSLGVWISKEKLIANGVHLESLTLVPNTDQERCVKCGARGAEEHHWAPRAIFKDQAGRWPKDYLCKSCHDEWHLMVTPQLVKQEPF